MFSVTRHNGKFSVVLIFILSNVILLICLRVSYIKRQRQLFITNYQDKYEDNITIDEYLDAQFRETMQIVHYVVKAKHKMDVINERQTVHNQHSLGPLSQSTPVLVIQVHENPFYFNEMLDSLKYVMGISKSLLIFAHDFFDYEINVLIKNITFAKYIQIFYPYSMQMHPRIFPGHDPQYCTEGFKCTANGNRRNAGLVQRKLFWWWLLNKTFDRLDVTTNYNGTILFLEEDNIVTEDLIYVLKLLERILPEDCPHCEIYSLGAHSTSFEHYHAQNGHAVIEAWSPKVKSTGLAFNRTVWNTIRRYSYEYCYFNDYSWDNSMRYIGTKKPHGKFLMINVKGPRVFKIKNCAKNISTVYCNMNYMVQKVKRYVKFIKRGLYPRNMVIRYMGDEVIQIKEGGFFNDIRDRELCMYFVTER